MRDDPDEARQDDAGFDDRCRAVDDALEPGACEAVLDGVFAEGGDEDVDVREDQRRPSIASRTEALSARSTPGWTPLPANVRSRTLARCPEDTSQRTRSGRHQAS